jgi:hypothetical protein
MAIGPGFVPAQLPTGQEYFKLPFNELLAGLSAKQDKFDKGLASVKGIPDLIPEAGLQTQDIRNQIISEMDTKLNPLMQKLQTTGEYNPYELEQIASSIKKDPRLTWLKQDVAMMPEANKLMAEGQFNYGLQDWNKEGKVRQLSWNGSQMVDPSTGKPVGSIGEAYKYIAPADVSAGMNKEFGRVLKENFREIPVDSEITAFFNPNTQKTEYQYTVKEGTGQTIKSLTEDEVRAKLETPALGGYAPLDALIESLPAAEYGPYLMGKLEQQGIMRGTPEFKEAYKEMWYGANKGLMFKYINYSTTPQTLSKGKTGGEESEYKLPATLGTTIPGILLTNDMKNLKGDVITNSGDFISFAQTPTEEIKTSFEKTGDTLLQASGLNTQGIYSEAVVDPKTGNYITIFKDSSGNEVDITKMVLNKPIAEQIEFKRLVEQTLTEQQTIQSNQEAAQHLINYYSQYSGFEGPSKVEYNKLYSEAASEVLGFVGQKSFDLKDPSKFNSQLIEQVIDVSLSGKNYTEEQKIKEKERLKSQIQNNFNNKLSQLNPKASKFYKELDSHLQGAAYGNIDAVPLITSNATLNKNIESVLLQALKSPEVLSNAQFADKKGSLKNDETKRNEIIKHFTEISSGKNPDDSKILQNALLRYDYNRPGKPLVVHYTFDDKTSIELPVEELFKGQNTEFLNNLETSLINKDKTNFNTTVNSQLQQTGGLFFKLPQSNYGTVFISPEEISGAGYTITPGTRIMASEKLPNVLITNTSQENFKVIDDFFQNRKGLSDEEIKEDFMNFLQKPQVAELGFQVITQPGVYKYFNKLPKVNFQ